MDKTQYMIVGGKGEGLVLEDGVIKIVEKYTYLGTNFTRAGGNEAEIKRKMNLTKVAIRQLHPIIWGNKLTQKTKTHIYVTAKA